MCTGYKLGGGEEKKQKDSDKKLEGNTFSDVGYDSATEKSTDKKQKIQNEMIFDAKAPGQYRHQFSDTFIL